MATIVTKDSFQAEVVNKKGLVLVDFFAEWCGPCKMVGPIIDELSKEMPDVTFVKVNVDNDPELASEYNVTSVPSFFIFKDGKVISQFVGAMGKEGFREKLSQVKAM
ncbi:MAG: thioredoxin [Patescibacteria group bacterium]|nr:thioredoxin [Patescibacteria group bacterium]